MSGKTVPPGKKGANEKEAKQSNAKKPRKRKTSEASSTETDTVSFEICQSEGNTFRSMGMYKKAVNSYSRALIMKPKHKGVLLARSQCYQQLGKNDLALADANEVVAQDAASVKGLLQKADVYYQMGQFEYALMLYHRGHKVRPEIQSFRLGIQKSKEAIENSIGEDAGIKLEKKGDLSFFIEEQKPASKRKETKQTYRRPTQYEMKTEQKKKTRNPSEKDKKTVKQLLGELYDDMTYLEDLLNESDKVSKTKTTEQVSELATECLDYLDSRAEFWQQQQPTYSREQEKINRSKGSKEEMTQTQKKLKKKREDATKWVIENMTEIDNALDNKDYDDCIDRSNRVLKELDSYSEAEVPRKKEYTADLHNYMGSAYMDLESFEEAIRHFRIDYDIAKELESSPGLSRALGSLGTVYAKAGQHVEAVKFFTERLLLNSTTLEDAWVYHELGRCHLELEDNDKALEFGKKSRKAAEEVTDEVWQLNSTILIAQTQLKMNDKDEALENFQLALEMSQSLKDTAAERAIRNTINKISGEEEVETGETVEPKETDITETGAKDTEIKETWPKETDTKKTEAKETDTKKTEAKETDTKKTEAKETDTKKTEAGSKDKGANETLSENKDLKDNKEMKETDPEDAKPMKAAEPKNAETKQTQSKDAETNSKTQKETKELSDSVERDDRKLIEYKVAVTISDLTDAGTDSDLEIELLGSKGSSGRLKLQTSETKSKKHDKGQTDVFSVITNDVGKISKLIVKQTSDLPGKGCHIEQVTVKKQEEDSVILFKCNKWFDKAQDDGLIERELVPEK